MIHRTRVTGSIGQDLIGSRRGYFGRFVSERLHGAMVRERGSTLALFLLELLIVDDLRLGLKLAAFLEICIHNDEVLLDVRIELKWRRFREHNVIRGQRTTLTDR